jgi:hypothetical protein
VAGNITTRFNCPICGVLIANKQLQRHQQMCLCTHPSCRAVTGVHGRQAGLTATISSSSKSNTNLAFTIEIWQQLLAWWWVGHWPNANRSRYLLGDDFSTSLGTSLSIFWTLNQSEKIRNEPSRNTMRCAYNCVGVIEESKVLVVDVAYRSPHLHQRV